MRAKLKFAWCMYGCGLRFEAPIGTAFHCPGPCGSYYVLPVEGRLSVSLPDFHPESPAPVVQRSYDVIYQAPPKPQLRSAKKDSAYEFDFLGD